MEVGCISKSISKGLAFAVVYCVLMVGAWQLSVDQWYLPAGIRVAALLFLRPRYWPLVFAGDAAAFLMIRSPKADQYGVLWAYLSPLLLAPLISVAPALCRRLLGEISQRERWLPVVALAISVWTALVNLSINHALAGPVATNLLESFLRFVVGQYLGILIFVPALVVWMRRNDRMINPRRLLGDFASATGVTAVIYLAANLATVEPSLRQILLLMMMAPAVALTFLHGWRGASLGIALSSIAFGLPSTAFEVAGAHDAVTFVAQMALAASATALFAFGATISAHFDRARRLGVSERHALRIAQNSFASNERHMRERVVALAQIQSHLDESRQRMAGWLEEMGHGAAAADLRRSGAKDARMFEEHATALYPLRIEQQGLYDVLQAGAFANVWAGGAEVRFQLRGKARALPVGLQLAAYRCACNAVALLSQGDPRRITVRARAWSAGGYRGVAVSVTSFAGRMTIPNATSMLAALELEGRVKAHGGAMKRRHANRVCFMLTEPISGATETQRFEAGLTAHHSPLMV